MLLADYRCAVVVIEPASGAYLGCMPAAERYQQRKVAPQTCLLQALHNSLGRAVPQQPRGNPVNARRIIRNNNKIDIVTVRQKRPKA